MDQLLAAGKEVLFISNVDNLGARVDFNIAQYMLQNQNDFVMEVTPKAPSDIKGGTLISYEGRTKLIEFSQIPHHKMSEFKSISQFKYFNTNNIWINLKALKRMGQELRLRSMDVIANQKVDSEGRNVVQFETAAGAAIEFFHAPVVIIVPRSRFIPVKTTTDLFLAQSNLYSNSEGVIQLASSRSFSTPLVSLSDEFKSIDEFKERVGKNLDILELMDLTVAGDVYFGDNIVMKGFVEVVAEKGETKYIPSRAQLGSPVVVKSQQNGQV